MKKIALALMLIPGLAFAAPSSTASLETKAKAAFADIAKAKTALDAGKTKTSNTWLTRAKTMLGSVMQHQPPEAQSQQQSPSALSSAEQRAERLDPTLAGKLGLGGDQNQAAPSTGVLGEAADLKSTYDKVSLAQSLLHKGDSTKAKSILDEIPTSPSDALQLLHR